MMAYNQQEGHCGQGGHLMTDMRMQALWLLRGSIPALTPHNNGGR
jgi:hypothetical protein